MVTNSSIPEDPIITIPFQATSGKVPIGDRGQNRTNRFSCRVEIHSYTTISGISGIRSMTGNPSVSAR